jgi:uncharacterized SAM-binding protein YcdF (DUF218 family)
MAFPFPENGRSSAYREPAAKRCLQTRVVVDVAALDDDSSIFGGTGSRQPGAGRSGRSRASSRQELDMDLLLWRKVLAAIVLPPIGPLLILVVGALLLPRTPRIGRGLVWAGIAALVLLSTGIVARGLLWVVDVSPPLRLEDASSAQAIVILGGGVREAPEYGGDTVARLSLDRVRYGARLARATGLPVLVTGGTFWGEGPAEGVVMREVLEREFGVPVKWVESRSRNTHQNAVRSAAILKPDEVTRVVLVAHGFDMRRAIAEFQAAGLEVVPAPTFVAPATPLVFGDFVPNVFALQSSYYALYEILANLARGW